LMKHTLDHCREIFQGHIIVAYFFNARGSSLEKTPLGMLRSLTYQLLDQDPLCYECFIPLFRDKRKKHKSWEWREGELQNYLFSQAKTCQSTPKVLLIDALDECNESEVRKIVEFLESLSISATETNVTLNICLSSRHYPTVSMKKRLELVVEKREEHGGDISIYVRDKLAERDEEIEKGILAKASGIFMWAILVVAMLNQAYDHGKVEAMHETLREVPPELEEVFGTLLSKDSSNKHETLLMLQWVLFSRRPLKPEELYFAMMAGIDTQKLGAWNRSKITSDAIRRRITDSSKGLIEIRKGEEETVQFIHESVNDFLLRNKRLETLDSGLESNAIGASHDRLRACCMSYLMIKELPLPEGRPHVDELGSIYPFLEYASTHVLEHAEEAQARCIVQKDFVQSLQQPHGEFEQLRRFHNAFEEYPRLGCSRGVRLLYMLSFHGHRELVNIVPLEKEVDVNAQGGIYGNALQAASVEGNEEIVAMLLEKGTDINAQGGIYGNALQAASYEGNEKVVAMLLEKGAAINAQGGTYSTALQAASWRESKKIVAMLLEKGADSNAQGGIYGNALQAASSNGNEEIVVMLLEKGADVNAQGGIYGNALQAASIAGNEKIVALLLKKGADVNAHGVFFGTALQGASLTGNKKIVAALLEKGADVNAQGGICGNALQAASINGHKKVVAMLLEKGFGVNTQGGEFDNALQAASTEGDKESVVMLLEKGADVNAQGGLYGNVLQSASWRGNKEIVALLLEKGADVNAQGGLGTALQAASWSGDEKIVAMLLKEGADVNAQGGVYGSALQAASVADKEEIVRMLLERGADVNAQGGVCGNALQAASAAESEEIAAMLLEKGADVNAQGGVYGNALQVALLKENEKIVAMLLEKGADINHPHRCTVLNPQPNTAHHLSKLIVLIITTFFMELWKQLLEKLSRKNN
jgi:ankyrin repeat protein